MKLLDTTITIPPQKSLDERLAPHALAIIIGALVFVIGGLALFLQHNWGFKVSTFAVLEYMALSFVAGISTGNYLKTREMVKNAKQNENDGDLKLTSFALANVACFLLATFFLLRAEVHILFILLIYFLFSWADIRIVKKLLADETLSILDSLPPDVAASSRREHYLCTVFGSIWLKEENGPSVVGFLLVLLAILIFLLIHLIFNVPLHSNSDTYYDQLKAFAGGAATFHLALSVLKYWSMIYRQDVVEVVLRDIETEASLDGQQLHALHMRERVKKFFLDSCEWWMPKLAFALRFAIVVVVVALILQLWAH